MDSGTVYTKYVCFKEFEVPEIPGTGNDLQSEGDSADIENGKFLSTVGA